MSINVTCPSCLTRFSVNDKFAGKSGPCPKCKSTIKIPDKSEEVVIHAPATDTPKDSKGKSVIAPIRRQEAKISIPMIVGASLGAIISLGVALAFGISKTPPPAALLAGGAIALAIPLVAAGYWFLQSDELQGYQGKELWTRAAICGGVFAMSWLIYVFVPPLIGSHDRLSEITPVEMIITISAMIALGTAASVLAMELELAQGVMLFMLYFVITFVLAWLSGAPLSEFIPGTPREGGAQPTITKPGDKPPVNNNSSSPTEEPKRPPNLLQ